MTDTTEATPRPAAAPAVPGLLVGKRILVTGVMTPRSIAYSVAERAQRAGAEVVLTSFGRVRSITERSARRLDPVPDILELDVTSSADLDAVVAELRGRWGGLDGCLHAIGFAPEDALGGRFLSAPWSSVATAMQVSAYSFAALGAAVAPLMEPAGGALVTLTFDGSHAYPIYDWMGPAKAALEAITRYLARDLGPRRIRVNALSAGPLETMAARSIPGFAGLKDYWSDQAPLGWDSADAAPVADVALFLLSDLARAVTGEVVFVDGGYHAMGAPPAAARPAEDGT